MPVNPEYSRLAVASECKKVQIPRSHAEVSGRRYYSPGQGRFLGRDPKMEKGGLNLYGFCRNNSINLWDYLGMSTEGELLARIQEIKDKLWNFTALQESGGLGEDTDANALQNELYELEDQYSALVALKRGIQYSKSSGSNNGSVGISEGAIATGPIGLPIATILFPPIIGQLLPVPAPPSRVLTFNFAFEQGAQTIEYSQMAATLLNNLQTVIDNYVAKTGGPSITVSATFIAKSVSAPPAGAWVRHTGQLTGTLDGISGPGTFNVLFASSPLLSLTHDFGWGFAGAIEGGRVLKKGTAIIGPTPNDLTLAHELGHMMGYRTTERDPDHSETLGNVMYSPSPPIDTGFIDSLYYDLLMRWSTPKQ